MSFTYETSRKETDGSTVLKIPYSKAYTSLGFKSNSLASTTTINTWARIKTNVAYTLGSVDSGNCQIVDNGDDTYNCKYIDSSDYKRLFKMDSSMFIDFTAGASMKVVEFRMCFKRSGVTYNLPTFSQLESNHDGECLSSTVLFELYPNDEVWFEMMNKTNSDNVTVKFSQITVLEV